MLESDQDNRSIFDGLNENAVTIVFRNLLYRYKSVRQALQRTLPEDIQKKVNLSYINSIETHRSGGTGKGIPDLVIRGHGFVLVIEIKVKKERGLQPAQQEAYVPWTQKAIQDEQTGFVTFLIPAGYHHQEDLKAQADEDDQRGRVRILPPIYWNQLVKELGPPKELADELIREFYNHLSERFVPKPVIFSTEEVRLMYSKETASGISKLMNIVEQVTDKLNCFNLQIKGSKSPDYGYTFSYSAREVWCGIWWEYWAEKGFPLCVAIWKEDHSPATLNSFKKQSEIKFVDFKDEDDGEWLIAGYKLPEPDKDCSELIAKIVTDIENLLRQDEPAHQSRMA